MDVLEKTSTLPTKSDTIKQRAGRWLAASSHWVDERILIGRPLQALLNFPVPLHAQKNLLYALGGLTATSFLLQVTSGLIMTFYYAPSLESAYNSVDYITYELPLGWLIRGVHVYNASAIFILSFLHLLRTFFTSAYKKPREITWLSGLLLLLLTVGFAFTGALLPWDQHGYWATIVGTEIGGSTPVLGPSILRLMRGGALLGQTSLTRFFFMHVFLLPAVLFLLLGIHLSQLRHGVAPAITRRGQELARRFVPFFPNRLFVHTLLGFGYLALLIYLSYVRRAPLEFPADPTSTAYTPRPEWYFLSLFQLLQYFPGRLEPLASMIIPALVIGSMFLLPFIDRSEERRPWRKPVTTGIAVFYVFMLLLLTVLALGAE
jgi:ubiquinol-cytochrome c reductase cytochrome b subunit